jgi:hypothetical protein
MKKYIISCFIILARIIDLYTTTLGLKDFKKEEQNLLVKMFNLNLFEFFLLEILLAFLLAIIYLYYEKNKHLFLINTISFTNYISLFLFNKIGINFFDLLLRYKYKNILVVLGSILPKYIIITSILFSLNNYWVYLINIGNERALNLYLSFDNYYFFDFLIFIFPIFLLIYFILRKLNYEFKKNIIS